MMAKTKREYILATCFLSGAAAIISFISLGTDEWVTAIATLDGDSEDNTYKFGLFGGIFKQRTIQIVEFELTSKKKYTYQVNDVINNFLQRSVHLVTTYVPCYVTAQRKRILKIYIIIPLIIPIFVQIVLRHEVLRQGYSYVILMK
jgi:hypothetical protein